MAQASGIAAQLGLAAETTYGTRVAPSRFLEFLDESLDASIERVESAALRANQRIARSDHWAAGKKGVAGDISLEVGNKGFGLIFKHMLGAIATTADGTLGWKHSATLADPLGLSFSIQIGKPDVGGTVRPFDYLGCVIPSWELGNSVDGILGLNLGIDGRELDTAQTLAASPTPAVTELFFWTEAIAKIATAEVKVKDISLRGSLGYDTERYFMQTAAQKKSAPIQADKVEITGEMTMEFEDLTQLNRYLNGTIAAVQATWTGVGTYDTGKPFKLDINLPTCRFDGTDPHVSGPGIVELTLPFKVLDSGTGAPITIDYYTSDTAP